MQEKACINREKSAVLYAGAFAGRSDVPGGSHKRNLSLTGRVVVANLDLLAGLNYLACVFPISFVTDRLWHYQKAEFIRGQPWCLLHGIVLDHRKLYRRWRDCWAAQSGETLPRPPGVEGAALLWSQQIPALAGGSGTSSGQEAALPLRHKPNSPVSCRMRGQGDGGARPVVVSCRGMILEKSLGMVVC
ncbi:uncharacterized [Tachysurus ichikawai]